MTTRFVDVSSAVGISFRPAVALNRFVGGGVAVVDVDGDSDLDILCAGDLAGLGIFLNRGDGTFEDRSAPEIADTLGFASADVDGDGVTDVVVLRDGHEGWLRLDAAGATVEDIDPAAPAAFAPAGDFGDADGDGDVDLYVGAYLDVAGQALVPTGQPNRLWINPGGAEVWTEEAAARTADLGTATTLAVLFADVAGDARAELIVAQDFGMVTRPNAVLQADGGGGFTDVATELGLSHAIFAMGVTEADFDGDGALDLYFTNAGANVMAMRRGAGFVDEARLRGAAVAWACDDSRPFGGWPVYDPASPNPWEAALATWIPQWADVSRDARVATSWDAEAFDHDQDGDVDLFVSNGVVLLEPSIPESHTQRGVLLDNLGDGTFADISLESGLDVVGDGRGAAAGDLDGDGDLDLVVAYADLFGVSAVRVFRNDSAGGMSLTVELVGTSSPPDGIGAVVEVRANGRDQRRRMSTGGGFASTQAARVHFGLGAAGQADEVVVHWPSGTVDRLLGVAAGALKVTEGSSP